MLVGNNPREAEIQNKRPGAASSSPAERYRLLAQRWSGEIETHVRILTSTAQMFGENSPQFQQYVTAMNEVAGLNEKVAAVEKSFAEQKQRPPTAEEKIEAITLEIMKRSPQTYESAYLTALTENPQLYNEYLAENGQSERPPQLKPSPGVFGNPWEV